MSLQWIELDGRAAEHNLSELRRGAGPGTRVCAVVKANAYGHGLAEMVRALPSADWFGVQSLEEGLRLRRLGVEKPVVLLGYVSLADLGAAVEAGLRMTVYNRETVERLAALPEGLPPARVHVKVETGTGRQGVLPGDLDGFFDLVARGSPRVVLDGISTHFANIEDTLNHGYAAAQRDRFAAAVEKMRRRFGTEPVAHAACTAAAILFPNTHFDMLRTGIGLYGLWPSRETYLAARTAASAAPSDGAAVLPDLRPVLSWKTRVVQIKELPEGSFVGYGCSYRCTRRTTVGILPVGYSDGYDRALGNRAHVLVRGKRAPVIGRICMNLTIVDLTDVPAARLEDEAVLLGSSGDESISAEAMAEWAGTINYETVSRIGSLVERRIV